MIYYEVYFEVDNGCSYTKRKALVKASSEEMAVVKLKAYISSLGYEISVSQVINVKEFNGDIFLGGER